MEATMYNVNNNKYYMKPWNVLHVHVHGSRDEQISSLEHPIIHLNIHEVMSTQRDIVSVFKSAVTILM